MILAIRFHHRGPFLSYFTFKQVSHTTETVAESVSPKINFEQSARFCLAGQELVAMGMHAYHRCELFMIIVYNARTRGLLPREAGVGTLMKRNNECDVNVPQVVRDLVKSTGYPF